jgi:magnesium-protoporphyrin IX monomethyl ester (oxidative) cyclase
METSRGCWWGQKSHCTFCGLNGTGLDYRAKSTQRVLDEMSELSERYQTNKIEVVDNIISNNHLETLIPALSQLDKPYNLFYETKANLKKHQVKQLSEAGVRWIQPGIESLHDEILKLMGKGTTGAINIQLLKWCREFGVRLYWGMLGDFPMEEDQWYQEMAEFMPLLHHLQPPKRLNGIVYTRFSPYHENPEKYGLEIAPFPSYQYIYPVSSSSINNLAYFFTKADSYDYIFSKPGLKAVAECIGKWDEEFFSNRKTYLCQSNLGGRVQIFDTRKCAIERIFYLEGLSAAVYLACDRALTKTELLDSLSKNHQMDREWEEVESVLKELKERKILLEISNRFLALAVNGEVPSLIQNEAFPGGYIAKNKTR